MVYFLAQRQGYYPRRGLGHGRGPWRATPWPLSSGSGFSGSLPPATFGETLLLFAWAGWYGLLVLIWRYPIKILGALVAPLAALMVSGTLILPARPGPSLPYSKGFWLTVHICLTLTGLCRPGHWPGLGGGPLPDPRETRGRPSRTQGGLSAFISTAGCRSLSQLDNLITGALPPAFPCSPPAHLRLLYAQHHPGRFFSWDPKGEF